MILSLLSHSIAVAACMLFVNSGDVDLIQAGQMSAAYLVIGLCCGIAGVRSAKGKLGVALAWLGIALNLTGVLFGLSWHGWVYRSPVDRFPALNCSLYNSMFVRDLVTKGYVRENRLVGKIEDLVEKSRREHWIEPMEDYRIPRCNLHEFDASPQYPAGLICKDHDFYFAYDGRLIKMPVRRFAMPSLSW